MATTFQFGNKRITLPGSYSRTKSQTRQLPVEVEYGTVLIIDWGNLGAGWGGGSGINGALLNGKQAINTFETLEDFQNAIMGGQAWLAGEKLFKPHDFGVPGVSKIKYIKASTTTPAYVTFTFTNGTFVLEVKNEGIGGNGIKDILTNLLAKGYGAQFKAGTDTDTYAMDLLVGTFKGLNEFGQPYDLVESKDTVPNILSSTGNISKIKDLIDFFQTDVDFKRWFNLRSYTITGPAIPTPTGLANTPSGTGGTLEAGTYSYVVAAVDNEGRETPASSASSSGALTGSTSSVALTWTPSLRASGYNVYRTIGGVTTKFSTTNPNFTDTGAAGTTGATAPSVNASIDAFLAGDITPTDLSNNLTMKLFAGGTEVYNASDLDDVLEAIADLDYNAILANDYGIDETNGATSAKNNKVLGHLINNAKFQKFMYIGGGKNKNEFNTTTGSVGIAKFFNSSRVHVVHGNYEKNVTITKTLTNNSLIKAAVVLGRIMGLVPQTQGTFKSISDISNELHVLSEKEKIEALNNGVLVTQYDDDFKAFTILQSINTLGKGKNEQVINADGTSYEISVERIFAHLNKKLMVQSKIDLLGQESGPNKSTLTSAEVEAWVKLALGKELPTPTNQNSLIVHFEQVVITQTQDAYFISYGAEPNSPINKLFFTTFAMDRNLNPINPINN